MPRTRIKICGITSLQDALAACEAGADALGMVLYAPGAARQVDANTARDMAMKLPPFVSAIGVTVDCPPNRVRQLLAHVPLSAVQLHGKESVQDVRSVQPTAAIKKLTATAELRTHAETWARAIVPNLCALLIDSHEGGSGKEADWSAVESFLAGADRASLPPIVLAGGLTPKNVREVVRRFRPWAVDVSSGVEAEPGSKSPELMKEFVKAVRTADER
jgi:phosphoribosylanthranilate isomerase